MNLKLRSLERHAFEFSLAVNEKRNVYISGGHIGNADEPESRVQMLNTRAFQYSEMPPLIEAMSSHGS